MHAGGIEERILGHCCRVVLYLGPCSWQQCVHVPLQTVEYGYPGHAEKIGELRCSPACYIVSHRVDSSCWQYIHALRQTN